VPTKLLLDPWSPDYEAPIQTDGPDIATKGQIDPNVETTDWKAVRPAATVQPRRICFVDGVRRVEARVLAQDDGKLIHGLFSSAGAGCVSSEGGTAAYDRIKISRYLILGAGRQKTENIAAGTQIIEFKGVASPGDTQDDLMNCLQNLMRTDEVALAEGFLGAGTYVFADGPLNFFSAATDPLVGVIKRIYLPYLDAPHFALVSQLQRGERTPLFSIRDGKYDRYSWFQRLAMPRAMEHGLAGIVRLEVRAALGLDQASEIANFAAVRLPEFASTAVRDPRSESLRGSDPAPPYPESRLLLGSNLRAARICSVHRAQRRRVVGPSPSFPYPRTWGVRFSSSLHTPASQHFETRYDDRFSTGDSDSAARTVSLPSLGHQAFGSGHDDDGRLWNQRSIRAR